MIDVEQVRDLISEDMVVELVSAIENDNPKFRGCLPENTELAIELVCDIVERSLFAVLKDHEEILTTIERCTCTAPITPQTLDRGYCLNCTRQVTLHTGWAQ